ncbi:DUF4350 domain-containing protein [Permianibacter aggregans]|uniref:DUF4350 domain-containing protein n=1 Tax=Permianibacter aggregans TaxID=1510150 RepID=A0A4R6UJR3_9GAMM|nr:DUF4350 domain-containing protein [Permianibacter aggregans]QGX39707.1 hypothetical protein E2H98_08575 [Permianibacter aggregans]TDQ47178.1 hypothetical protein EV696_111106 [Permianibacter aggregans]
MTDRQRQLLWFGLTVVLLALIAAGWFYFLEKRTIAVPHHSTEAMRNDFLAASRWLQQRDYVVHSHDNLTAAMRDTLPGGALLFAQGTGMMTGDTAEHILDWVADGNVMIMVPQYVAYSESTDEEERDQDEVNQLVETDPIGDYLGVYLGDRRQTEREEQDEAESDAEASEQDEEEIEEPENTFRPILPRSEALAASDSIQFTALSYPLLIAKQHWRHLDFQDEYQAPILHDAKGDVIRVYREGRGYIVVLATMSFTNATLRDRDHGELLWQLLQLNPDRKQLTIIQRVEMPNWYQALWQQFHLALIAAAITLLLIIWLSLRRFGPLLAEPGDERRAQMEHVMASARWLWRLPAGRQRLLDAARTETMQQLKRRLPELQRLADGEKLQRLHRETTISLDHLQQALFEPAANQPRRFTAQLQTLQKLRSHYE